MSEPGRLKGDCFPWKLTPSQTIWSQLSPRCSSSKAVPVQEPATGSVTWLTSRLETDTCWIGTQMSHYLNFRWHTFILFSSPEEKKSFEIWIFVSSQRRPRKWKWIKNGITTRREIFLFRNLVKIFSSLSLARPRNNGSSHGLDPVLLIKFHPLFPL